MSAIASIDDACLRVSVAAYIDEIKKLPELPSGLCYIPVITSIRPHRNTYWCDAIIHIQKMTENEMGRLTKTVVEPPDRVPCYQVCTSVSQDLMRYLKENPELISVLADQIVHEIQKEIARL